MVDLNKTDIPDEPMTITNLLLTYRNALEEVSRNLYERRGEVEDVIADILQDIVASLNATCDMSRENQL